MRADLQTARDGRPDASDPAVVGSHVGGSERLTQHGDILRSAVAKPSPCGQRSDLFSFVRVVVVVVGNRNGARTGVANLISRSYHDCEFPLIIVPHVSPPA